MSGSRLIVPFDFNPAETVLVSGANYTVPAGKYGIFSQFTATNSVTQANNLATGTYNVIPEFQLNSASIPARSILRLQTQNSGVRTYTLANNTGLQSVSDISLAATPVTASYIMGSEARVSIANTGYATGTFILGSLTTIAAYTRRTTSFNTPVLFSSVVLELNANTATTMNLELVLQNNSWTDSRWLKSGDILTATNGGSVSCIATLYNVVS